MPIDDLHLKMPPVPSRATAVPRPTEITGNKDFGMLFRLQRWQDIDSTAGRPNDDPTRNDRSIKKTYEIFRDFGNTSTWAVSLGLNWQERFIILDAASTVFS